MLTKSRLIGGLLATTMFAGGCTAPTYEGLKAVRDGGYALTATARYMDACPTDTPEGIHGIEAQGDTERATAGLRGFATDFALNLIGSSLDAAIKGRNGAFVATGVMGAPEKVVGGAHTSNCLVIYRGVRGDVRDNRIGTGLPRNLLAALGLAEQPGFYLELRETHPGNNRILSVNHLQYAETSANARGSGMKSVSVVIGLAAASIVAKDVATAQEVYRLNLGRLRIGHIYGTELGVSATSGAAEAGVHNIVVQVTEADQPSLALQALLDAFKSNRTNIANAIQN